MSSTHAWMDGVPLELRPRYYPKPPLRFKDIDIYIPLDAIENDYDFTEERRVLAECKMWDEEKEKERIAEEERKRLQAEEDERLRLEGERRAIELLEKGASLDDTTNSSDVETSLAAELNSKFTMGENADESQKEEQDNNSAVGVPNHYNNSCNSSKQNSHHESPTSEENSTISQPHPVQHSSEPEPVVPVPLPSMHHHQAINGYHYMMGSDMQMPMYSQTVPHYYNYYVPPPPSVVAPPTSMPLSMGQQHSLPQPTPNIQQMPQPQPPAVPPVLQYQSISAGVSGVANSHHPESNFQLHYVQSHQTEVAYAPLQSTTATLTSSSGCDSGTSSPVVSEKPSQMVSSTSPHGLGQKSPSQTNLSKPVVELKDLSDFESVMANQYDNVELKSINDMEVLASVLKNHVPPSQNSQNTTTAVVTDSQSTSGSTGSSYANGGGYYHQPTPIYPPVSSQCPYPAGPSTWSHQNGYYPPPPPVSNSNSAVANSIAPPPPPQNSHIPSPTQAVEQQQQHQTNNPDADSTSNSFTKLHFPFLTSMAASSRMNRDRDSGLGYLTSSFNHSNWGQSGSTPPQHPSSDDIASQNPFLSSYVQSHTPMQRHQYWPTSHLSHQPPQPQQHHNPYSAHTTVTPVQNGPVQSTIGASNFIATSGPSTAPPTGSQHALR